MHIVSNIEKERKVQRLQRSKKHRHHYQMTASNSTSVLKPSQRHRQKFNRSIRSVSPGWAEDVESIQQVLSSWTYNRPRLSLQSWAQWPTSKKNKTVLGFAQSAEIEKDLIMHSWHSILLICGCLIILFHHHASQITFHSISNQKGVTRFC